MWGTTAGCTAFGEIRIEEVTFRQLENELTESRWLEAVVEVDVRREEGPFDYLRGAEVSLALAIEVDEGALRRFEFFSASAEPVALEDGRSVIRFYLPPEILDMYDVRGEPFSYLATVRRSDGGEVVRASPRLESEAAMASFQDRLAEQRAVNDGVLRPQHLSPFFDYYPEDTPTFKLEATAR